MRLSVVVPTFNEALHIEDTVSAALRIGVGAWGIVQGLYSLGVPPWALAKLYPDARRCGDAEYQG